MRLSFRDRDILARIALHADLSLRELARVSGHQVHSVRHLIDRMREAGTLKKNWIIDPLRLGWQRYHVLFSTALNISKNRKAFIEAIIASPRVSSFSELGGDYDFQMNVLARDVGEVLELLRDVTRHFGPVFYTKSLTVQNHVLYFPRKYLASGTLKPERLELGAAGERVQIDDVDHRLLCAVSADADMAQGELSKRVGASVATVQQRLKKLRERGVIRGAMYAPTLTAFGAQNYRILLYVRGIDVALGKAIVRWAEAEKRCTSMAEGFGGADYDIGVEVEQVEQLVAIKEELRSRFGDSLASIQVLSRFGVFKYKPYPFAEDEKFNRL